MESLPASSLLQELRASLPSSTSQPLPPPANSMPLTVNSMPSPLTMFSSPLLDSSSSLSLAAHQVLGYQKIPENRKEIKYSHDCLMTQASGI